MMKYLIFVLLILLPLYVVSEDAPEIEGIEDLQWKNRVILIRSADEDVLAQSLNDSVSAIDDRDIVWFILNGAEVTSNYPGKISAKFAANTTGKYSSAGAKVILIGKDGEVKRAADTLALDVLFATIDAMPMRINEIQEKKNNGD
ncbi:DUF4174 domain-containing protein [Microbulbifer hydrolyticus]|uniref:DUF4174 domain-containing protein n=1 Tax=Microbulbifer hydrolyticus TaxID=48074 RepID=A0A6P1TCD9_9GAMM|nr:DUF4174 domain-containing protein [Microbulbifer hydrolyticus]MBB5210268.1 hypothetical protein [Microbulbifer hydrolyticus]QHQ39230.1 DUF4174 domain-containing protein [Microbulbifer hydrolyticus]